MAFVFFVVKKLFVVKNVVLGGWRREKTCVFSVMICIEMRYASGYTLALGKGFTTKEQSMRRVLVLLGMAVFLAACGGTSPDTLRKECKDASEVYYCDQTDLCCAGACVKEDVFNCGACGNSCGVGNVCKEGMCFCEADQSQCLTACCSTGCVDVLSNVAHCNACENACNKGELCVNASCESNCPDGFSQCQDQCVDTKNNAKHCGDCGATCPDPSESRLHIERSYCLNSQCYIVCAKGYADADDDINSGCEKEVSSVCGNGFIEEGEACDADKLNDQTCESQVGEGSRGTLRCAPDCMSFITSDCSAATTCGNGRIDGSERCDNNDLGGNTCESVLGAGSTGFLLCKGNCQEFDTRGCSKPTLCGNNQLDAGEVCDAEKLNNQNCASVVGVGSTGNLKCAANCDAFDISGCTARAVCGDGIINGTEECDGTKFDGATCESRVGAGSKGTLTCDNCKISTKNCSAASTCGNNRIDGSDVCDGTALKAGVSCETVVGPGSIGTLRCLANCAGYDISGCTAPASCGNNIIESKEVCDGARLNDKTCASEVGPNSVGTLRCNSSCSGFDTSGCSASTSCGNSVIERGEVCDGTSLAGATCANKVGAGSVGYVLCASDCKSFNLSACSAPSTCNNGTIDAGEVCDGTKLNGATCASVVGAGSTGVLKCGDGCKHFDTRGCSAPQSCGDGKIDIGEVCDGANLAGATCALIVGYGSTGKLRCKANCSDYDTGLCSPEVKCGNGKLEPEEVCDGAQLNGRTCATQVGPGSTGTPLCNATCTGYENGSCTEASKCGNGNIDAGEVCDGTNLNGRTCAQVVGHGSVGTPTCNSTCSGFNVGSCTPEVKCGNGVIDTGEDCDGTKLNGATCASVVGAGSTGVLKCGDGCKHFDTRGCSAPPSCGNGNLDSGEACDGTKFRNGSNACASYDPALYSSGTLTCNGNCTINVGSCVKKCGNNTIDAGEVCDGTKLGGATCASIVGTGSTGTLRCSNDCKSYDTASCSAAAYCGDGIVQEELGEDCDGSAYLLDITTCKDYSDDYASGNLKCTPSCSVDTSSCVAKDVCGNGRIEQGEVCDGAQLNGKTCETQLGAGYTGSLLCKSDCSGFDTSQCVAPGTCIEDSYRCVGQQLQLCMYGDWEDDTLCEANEVCNALKGQCMAEAEQPPAWCQFKHLESSNGIGYGRILLNDGKTINDVLGYMSCSTDLNQAVSGWPLNPDSDHNPACSDCGNNVEFMSDPLVADPGTYHCTFIFSYGTDDYACTPNGGAPIVIDASTKLTQTQTRSITISPATGLNLYFSEYIEGSSNNRAVEIYNAENVSIDLSARVCDVNVYSNGKTTSSTIHLTGSIAPKSVYSLCNSSINASANCSQKSGALSHTGNDAIELKCGAQVYDVIGKIGQDPGNAGWKGVSGGTTISTTDHTLERKCSVTSGDRVGSDAFDPSVEWNSKGVDILTGLGKFHCP